MAEQLPADLIQLISAASNVCYVMHSDPAEIRRGDAPKLWRALDFLEAAVHAWARNAS